MHRRTVLGTLALGATAGCVDDLLGENCGPGDDSVEEVLADFEPGERVRLKGEVRGITEDGTEFKLADSTGAAHVIGWKGSYDGQPEGCMTVDGVAVETFERADAELLGVYSERIESA